jgi:hypothetical protein
MTQDQLGRVLESIEPLVARYLGNAGLSLWESGYGCLAAISLMIGHATERDDLPAEDAAAFVAYVEAMAGRDGNEAVASWIMDLARAIDDIGSGERWKYGGGPEVDPC